ncbi:PHD-zinc-finger-like domain protein, partial [Trifolium medium]|nr:PHD-zinc-finger-like domain protein [Trifolium medium]
MTLMFWGSCVGITWYCNVLSKLQPSLYYLSSYYLFKDYAEYLMVYYLQKTCSLYKQVKGLFVYKSGIHGLGLYTSQLISQGRMVVEYVGEIVRQSVADKREIEYISGRKLQYKSACYLFRMDNEH